jgi:hypothetical protein
MYMGWIFATLVVVGIPIAGILSGTIATWLKYRYRRAALETLKAYAANGREPPEVLIKTLTYPSAADHERDWGGHDAEPPETANRTADPDREARRAARRARKDWKWTYPRTAERAWREAIWWATLAGGFWAAATYVASPTAHGPLLIISYILAAVAVGSVLSAILTSIVRANDRRTD